MQSRLSPEVAAIVDRIAHPARLQLTWVLDQDADLAGTNLHILYAHR